MDAPRLIACHECDLISKIPRITQKAVARCTRCGAVLYRHKCNSLDRTLAFAVTGTILFIIANLFPFLTIKLDTRIQETTLISGVLELYSQGFWVLAALVFLTSILVPLIQLISMLYLLIPLKLNRTPWKLKQVFRYERMVRPWGMMEVFMLGILVSAVKLAKMAKIVPGAALISFMALIFILAAMAASFDPHLVWGRMEPAHDDH